MLRRGGRAVEGTSLENWQRRKAFVGSNPTLSARMLARHLLSRQDAVGLPSGNVRFGSKQTFRGTIATFALPPEADIRREWHVCFGATIGSISDDCLSVHEHRFASPRTAQPVHTRVARGCTSG
jgi:hypothetical protein